MSKKRNKNKQAAVTERSYHGDPMLFVPSPWWVLAGLTEDGWVQLYQYGSETAADVDYGMVLDLEDEIHARYFDFAVIPPELGHSINPNIKGQNREWEEATSPATSAARASAGRSAAASVAPAARGRITHRKKN
jgi:hypothetical protein